MNKDTIALGLSLLTQYLTAARELGVAILQSRKDGVPIDLAPFRAKFQSALADLDAEIAKAKEEER